ncbi:ubiquitin-like protein [Streptomyces sindenensis]|uniref:ubiquitin-like protein n=1 Tax=Streptomyces sindenensis TaxID=67363 RepID=UPI001679C6F2|nr:ubiquitin-like protein [Streptomyces sindenensis]GGP88191.1 hypothetical protein GCM10010231_66860 [Streptomyces sindenensis]
MTDQTGLAEDGTSDGGSIQVRVRSVEGNEFTFRIRRASPMIKLMSAYCVRLGEAAHSVRFLYDGDRITGEATAESLGLENGDTIDVMRQHAEDPAA